MKKASRATSFKARQAKKSAISQQEALVTFSRLCELYPNPRTELIYEGPFQLLIAVILSAQCTDAQVNKATPGLFKRFPTAETLKNAKLQEVEKLVHSCGFYRAKARAIVKTASDIVDKFNGTIPPEMDKLTTLAGVGRKTASVVLNQAFDIPAIAVDTHVLRVSQRIGWAKHDTPEKVEVELKTLLPEELWGAVNGTLILHGRKTCKARKPLCELCPIQGDCRFFESLQR